MRRVVALLLAREVGSGAVRPGVYGLLRGVGVVGSQTELLEDGSRRGSVGEGCASACRMEAGGAGWQPLEEGLERRRHGD